MSLRRPPIESLTVDDLRFAVRWSARRRTIGITVKRDGELRRGRAARAPPRAGSRRSCARSSPGCAASSPSSRRSDLRPSPRQVVAGERLPVPRAASTRSRSPTGRRSPSPCAATPSRSTAPWTARRAPPWSPGTRRGRASTSTRPSRATRRSSAPRRPRVVVRDLGKRRWGVCDHRTLTVSFHWQLITQPPELVDYVVVHELAHLHEPNHGPGFWRRVADVLPDCKERRKRLSRRGDQLAF